MYMSQTFLLADQRVRFGWEELRSTTYVQRLTRLTITGVCTVSVLLILASAAQWSFGLGPAVSRKPLSTQKDRNSHDFERGFAIVQWYCIGAVWIMCSLITCQWAGEDFSDEVLMKVRHQTSDTVIRNSKAKYGPVATCLLHFATSSFESSQKRNERKISQSSEKSETSEFDLWFGAHFCAYAPKWCQNRQPSAGRSPRSPE